jgi:4-hydroxybenzoate polyprenyltransferase
VAEAYLDVAGLAGIPDPNASPLVINLDGALLRTDVSDTAYACGVSALLASPRGAITKMVRDRQSIGQFLKTGIDYSALPYEPSVLNLALAARAQDRKVYLATAVNAVHAQAIAAHFGLDGVVMLDVEGSVLDTSDPAALAIRSTGFDYVIHDRAEPALLAGAKGFVAPLPDRTAARQDQYEIISGRRRIAYATWRDALRVHQYAKNTLVFVPLLTSHNFNVQALTNASLAFVAFSACASSAYVLNDVLDFRADRLHPTKRSRAIASGALPITAALTVIPLLAATAAFVAAMVSWSFLAAIVAYLCLTVMYSAHLKKKMLIDIITLAGLYTIRIVGGAIAIGVAMSEWLLIFSLFVFTSLALIKRYSELTLRISNGLADSVNRDYRVGDLNVVAALAAASGMNAITVFSLYTTSPVVAASYSRPWLLWLLDPLLLYWIGRALMIAHRDAMTDDPIVYAFRDLHSRVTVLLMACIVLAAI